MGSGAGTGAPSLATHCESSSHLKSASISATFSGALHLLAVHRNEKAADYNHLKDLLDRVTSRCSSIHNERYADNLLRSYKALRRDVLAKLAFPNLHAPLLERHLNQARCQENDLYKNICKHLKWQAQE